MIEVSLGKDVIAMLARLEGWCPEAEWTLVDDLMIDKVIEDNAQLMDDLIERGD